MYELRLENDQIFSLFNFWNPWNSLSEIRRFAADGVTLSSVSPGLENPAPPGLVTDICTDILTAGAIADEGIVDGDKSHALTSSGVKDHLPQICRNWDFVVNQENLLIIYLKNI